MVTRVPVWQFEKGRSGKQRVKVVRVQPNNNIMIWSLLSLKRTTCHDLSREEPHEIRTAFERNKRSMSSVSLSFTFIPIVCGSSVMKSLSSGLNWGLHTLLFLRRHKSPPHTYLIEVNGYRHRGHRAQDTWEGKSRCRDRSCSCISSLRVIKMYGCQDNEGNSYLSSAERVIVVFVI